jgi:hypothetical protein
MLGWVGNANDADDGVLYQVSGPIGPTCAFLEIRLWRSPSYK